MGKEPINKHVGHSFRLIHNGIEHYFSIHNMESFGVKLTMSQSAILRYLYDNRDRDIFQRDIENAFQISGATASNTLKGMERQEVVHREPMPDDARKKKITMTSKGKEYHEKAIANLKELEETILMGMTDEEITTYRGLLERTIQNLEAKTGKLCCKKNNKK